MLVKVSKYMVVVPHKSDVLIMIHFAFMLIDVYLLCIFILKFWEGHYVRVYVNNFGKSGQYSSFMRFSQSFDIHSSLNWWWQWCQRLSKSWTSIILGIRKQSIFSFHWLLSRVEFITYHVQLQNFSSSIQSIAPFLMEKNSSSDEKCGWDLAKRNFQVWKFPS